MKVAVRYFSRGGHTKSLAETIAIGAGTEAVSVDSISADLKEPVDMLFIGGGLYAYHLDPRLTEWIGHLDKSMVKKAYVFSDAGLSKHGISLLKKALSAREIPVADESFFVRTKKMDGKMAEAQAFGAVAVKNAGGEK